MATSSKTAAPAPVKKNKVNSFSPSKVQDTTIVDSEGKTVGHVRVKPSGVLWSPKNGKDWYGLPLDQFAAFIEANGKKQKS
jgi:hypothetical protein